jgi:hypothetical protein
MEGNFLHEDFFNDLGGVLSSFLNIVDDRSLTVVRPREITQLHRNMFKILYRIASGISNKNKSVNIALVYDVKYDIKI